jgi:hypothetical protein
MIVTIPILSVAFCDTPVCKLDADSLTLPLTVFHVKLLLIVAR